MVSNPLSKSTIIREHTGEIHSLHHPSGNEHWPSMFEETRDMLDMSIFCYWAGDVRRLIKNNQLTDEKTVNALFQMPSTFQELGDALENNREFLSKNLAKNPSFELYSGALGGVCERYREIGAKSENQDFFRLIHFEDEHEASFGGPVYAFTINHAMKRITIGFRGSVTTRDFMCDWKTSLCNIPNPLAGEPRSLGEYIQIHHGFKEYLYDPILDTEKKDGKIEKQPLIFFILEKVAKLFEEYPDYHLYTAGHSLGGALATLFAMEAGASKDPRIKKPVTCITIAGPRVGNLTFARTFKKLEKSRRVRCLRVVNDDDLIPEVPATANVNCLYISCCQSKIYRHVGVTCQLHREKKPLITYPHHYSSPTRLFLSDCSSLIKGIVTAILKTPFMCACQTNFASSHSCQEYFERLHRGEKDLIQRHVNEIFGDFHKDMLLNKLVDANTNAKRAH